jgi:hypothetical protein
VGFSLLINRNIFCQLTGSHLELNAEDPQKLGDPLNATPVPKYFQQLKQITTASQKHKDSLGANTLLKYSYLA